jgi:hypothetical protein
MEPGATACCSVNLRTRHVKVSRESIVKEVAATLRKDDLRSGFAFHIITVLPPSDRVASGLTQM